MRPRRWAEPQPASPAPAPALPATRRTKLGLALVVAVLVAVLVALPAARPAAGAPDAAAAWAEARARSGWGPFLLPAQGPYQQMRFAYLHESPELLPAGTVQAAVALTGNNIWARDRGAHLVDGEWWRAVPLARRALTDRLDASFQWPLLYLTPGFADRSIEDYHRLTDLPNDSRQDHPRNRLRFERTGADGTTTVLLGDSDEGLSARAPVVALRLGLSAPGARIPVTAKLAVSLPELEAESPVVARTYRDWALGLAAAARLWGPLAGTVSGAYVRTRPGPADLARAQWSGLVSLDLTVWDTLAVVGQLVAETPVGRRSDSGFDNPTYEVALGGKWDNGAGLRVEAGFTENFINHDNTIDVGLHAGVALVFP